MALNTKEAQELTVLLELRRSIHQDLSGPMTGREEENKLLARVKAQVGVEIKRIAELILS